MQSVHELKRREFLHSLQTLSSWNARPLRYFAGSLSDNCKNMHRERNSSRCHDSDHGVENISLHSKRNPDFIDRQNKTADSLASAGGILLQVPQPSGRGEFISPAL